MLIVVYVSIFCPASARRVRLSLLLCLLFLSYGFLLSILNNSIANSIDKPEYYIPILVLGAYLFAGQNPPIISKVLAQALFTYTLLIFILTVALGGFKFAFPPSFEYEYLSSVQNQDISYSQGISKFYGFGAVCAVFIAFTENRWQVRLAFIFAALAFVLLSLLGGGRGDSVSTVIVVGFYILFRSSRQGVAFAVCLMCIIIYNLNLSSLAEFTIFNRLSDLNDGIGVRGVLVEQSVALLTNDPVCWVVGCGFGFFQTYYHYNASLYPHNVFLEAVIVFGFPITFFIIIPVIRGVLIWLSDKSREDGFFILFIYFTLVDFKSGTLLSSWFFVAGIINFALIGSARTPARSRIMARYRRIQL